MMSEMSLKFFQISSCLIVLFSLPGCKTTPNAKLEFSDGSYEGNLNRDGQKHGTGIYRWIDGSIYEGDYSDDLRHGKGRFLWANGESYEGDYLKDERTGKGIYLWPDGSLYEGEFLSGKRHGWGRYQSADGTIYEGEWFDDVQHGQGTLVYTDGRTMKGIWRKGSLISKPSILPTASQKPELPTVNLDESMIEDTSVRPSPNPERIPLSLEANVGHAVLTEYSSSSEPALPAPTATPVDNSAGLQQATSESIDPSLDEAPRSAEPSSPNGDNEIEESGNPDWTGTVSEAESFFITELIDGLDTVRLRSNGIPFSGKMRIMNQSGQAQGEVNLLNGRMHGEEIFYGESGDIVEKNFWENGRQVGQ